MIRVRVFALVALGAGLLCAAKAFDIATGPLDAGPAIAEEAPAAETPAAQATPTDPAGPADPAAGEATEAVMSPSEFQVLQSLSKRREELDARAREQEMREQLLAATEQRVNERIAELKTIEGRIEALLQKRDAAAEERLGGLVKTYESMKPVDAARIFEKLDPEVLLEVAERMKPVKIGAVLSQMEPMLAQKLTVQLAKRLDLPEAPPPSAPEAGAVAPAPEGAPGSEAAPPPKG